MALTPYPLIRLSGKVVATRETEVPPRAEERDEHTGEVTRKGFDGTKYGEVALQVPDSVLDGERSDVPAIQVIRCKTEDLGQYRKGEDVTVLCSVWSTLEGQPGRFRNVVTFRAFEKLSAAAPSVRSAA